MARLGFPGIRLAVPAVLFALLLSFLLPLRLTNWRRADLLILYQTIVLGWTLAGATAAAYFAGRYWQTTRDTLYVSNYLSLSNQWNQVFLRINQDQAKLKLLELKVAEEGTEQTKSDALTQVQWEQARPLVQEIMTTFDAWIVHNRLGAFPRLESFSTWDWWRNTIIGYFKRYPLLIGALRDTEKAGTKEYSPWLQELRKEAERRLAEKTAKSPGRD